MSASGTSTPARQSLDMARHTHQPGAGSTSYTLPHRPSLSRDPSYVSQTTTASSTAAHAGTPNTSNHSITSQHYADTAAYRSEMEIVKAENESLRQRVRTLERALRARRRDSSNSDATRPEMNTARANRDRESGSSAVVTSPEPRASVAAWAASEGGGVGGVAPPRERSESQSTTASSSRRGGGGVGVTAEDDVRLGESAGSVGLGRGV